MIPNKPKPLIEILVDEACGVPASLTGDQQEQAADLLVKVADMAYRFCRLNVPGSELRLRQLVTELEQLGWYNAETVEVWEHFNCTLILPYNRRRVAGGRGERWRKELTHACQCSPWKRSDKGEWRIWRRGRWSKPEIGEVSPQHISRAVVEASEPPQRFGGER